MYDHATLADIQHRLSKGWVIRNDETATLLKMAVELLRMKEGLGIGPALKWWDEKQPEKKVVGP